jgi:ornithine--oxo-acid transaminase
LLSTGEMQTRAKHLGERMHAALRDLQTAGYGIDEVRGVGLWAGIDIDPSLATGRQVCEKLMEAGVLAKDTHGTTIRLAPPIVIDDADLGWAVERLGDVLKQLA